jgi:hypothetical protein
MAGEAKTNKFLIGEATLMVGPMASVFDLQPTAHSLGLVKNLAVAVETGNVELTQGIENVPIFSVQNQFNPSASCEVYEYTARNLSYGLGLDASGVAFDEPAASGPYTLNTLVAAAATSIVLATGQGATFVVGDSVIMQVGEDVIYTGKVTAKVTDTLTVSPATPPVITWPIATTRVFRARAISAAGGNTNFLSAKAVVMNPGALAPTVILFPKIRVSKGFNLAIGTQDFANLPFEFMPYPLTASDTLYSQFGPGEVFKVVMT